MITMKEWIFQQQLSPSLKRTGPKFLTDDNVLEDVRVVVGAGRAHLDSSERAHEKERAGEAFDREPSAQAAVNSPCVAYHPEYVPANTPPGGEEESSRARRGYRRGREGGRETRTGPVLYVATQRT